MLPKIKPRFWIDQQDYSWTKLRAEVIRHSVIRLGGGTTAQGIGIRDATGAGQRRSVVAAAL